MDNNLNSFTKGRQGLLKWFFIVFLLIFAVLSAFYGYFYYVDQMEKDLSKKLRVFLDKKEKPFEQWQKSLKKKEKAQAKKELLALSDDFKNLYLSMPRRNNAIYAGLQYAFLHWHLGNKKIAEDFFLQMRRTSKKNPFLPTILYSLALLSSDRGAYEQTMVFVEDFIKKYPNDFLLGEMLFVKARVLFQEKRFRESFEVYQSILKNKDLSLFSQLADVELSYLEAMNLHFPSDGDASKIPDGREKAGKMKESKKKP